MIGLPLIEVSLDSWNAATRNEGVIVSPYIKRRRRWRWRRRSRRYIKERKRNALGCKARLDA